MRLLGSRPANAFTFCEGCAAEGWGQNCWIWSLPAVEDQIVGETWCTAGVDEYQGFTTGRVRANRGGALQRLARRVKALLGRGAR